MKKSWLISIVVVICVFGGGITYYQSTKQGTINNVKQSLPQKNDVQSHNQVENIVKNNPSVQSFQNAEKKKFWIIKLTRHFLVVNSRMWK